MIDLNINKLRERIKNNEYVPYVNADGTRVINICGVEVEASAYDMLITRLYSSNQSRAITSFTEALNGQAMCGGDIQRLLQQRYEAEMLIPVSTKQGINSFMLYGSHPYIVDPSYPLQENADMIFKASEIKNTVNPWLTMDGRQDSALQYSINQQELRRSIQRDIAEGKVQEGYCIPGGILGLQILLIGADSELLLKAQDVIRFSIESIKREGKKHPVSDELKKQAERLQEIQSFSSLLIATSQYQKNESENLFEF